MKTLNSILLVDDNEDDNFIHKKAIVKAHVLPSEKHIFIKENGEEAYEFLLDKKNKEIYGEKFPPCLMFLDINMPCMDGFEFLEELQKCRQKFTYICVIILTSSVNHADKQRLKQFPQVAKCIKKPLTKDIVQEIHQEQFC